MPDEVVSKNQSAEATRESEISTRTLSEGELKQEVFQRALALASAAAIVASGHWGWLLVVPLVGYLPAWLGHWRFERNSPATFRYPLYSLRGDFTLLLEVLSGRRRW